MNEEEPENKWIVVSTAVKSVGDLSVNKGSSFSSFSAKR